MSSSEDALYDNLEKKWNKRFAALLGISEDELAQLEYSENELTTNDDMVYAVEYTFDENSPKEILSKIKGLNEDYRIIFDTGAIGYYETD